MRSAIRPRPGRAFHGPPGTGKTYLARRLARHLTSGRPECVQLAEALRPYGGTVRLQDERHHLDRAHRVRLRPDLVLDSADGSPLPVVDAKYKTGDTPQDDLYQMLAYCTAMGLDRAHLVYASNNGTHTHVITGTDDVQIVETALDLSAPPEELRAQVAGLAHRIVVENPGPRS